MLRCGCSLALTYITKPGDTLVQDDEDVKPPAPHPTPQNDTDIIELEARIAAHEIRIKLLAEQV